MESPKSFEGKQEYGRSLTGVSELIKIRRKGDYIRAEGVDINGGISSK